MTDWPARPYIAPNTLHVCDALELLRALPDQSADLIATDPPYYKVKKAAWDNAWNTPSAFIKWLGGILDEMQRVLKPNGSLYMFASPKMAARVEVAISERFNVLNNIRWVKNEGWYHKNAKEELRAYLAPWESCIFAEPKASNVEYATHEYELNGYVYQPLKDWFRSCTRKHNIGLGQFNEVLGVATNGGGLASRYFGSKVEFQLPTSARYSQMQNVFPGVFTREYEDLRREYEDRRREYEDLRREYEDRRRPFNSSPDKPYTDVWTFPTVGAYPAKHECEKPLDMMKHIVSISSRPNGLVVDPFAGSGNTLLAAQMLGRRFIGGDMSAHWVDIASKRVFPTFGQPPRRKREEKPITDLPLFAGLAS